MNVERSATRSLAEENPTYATTTPAAAAKIDLNLNQRNRLKDLIAKSAAQKVIAEGKYAVHLGERVQHANIINEKDCIKVMLKGWLDKQVWKEINDILRVHQFAWLSNGKDSCWIRNDER